MNLYTFNSVELEGFRSFKRKQTFQLDRPPGLYYISGCNKVQKRLESEGSGKSSIIDAICWALFGKTTRGLNGPKVKNWHAKTCRVSVPFTKDDIDYTITRSQGPNSLTLSQGKDTQTIAQEELE